MDKHAQGYRQKMMSKRVMNCYNILLVFTQLMLLLIWLMINDEKNLLEIIIVTNGNLTDPANP